MNRATKWRLCVGIDERPDLGDELIAVVSDDHIEERVPCFSTESVEQLAEF